MRVGVPIEALSPKLTDMVDCEIGLSSDHVHAGMGFDTLCCSQCEKSGGLGLGNDFGEGHSGLQEIRIKRERVCILKAERCGVDDEWPASGSGLPALATLLPKSAFTVSASASALSKVRFDTVMLLAPASTSANAIATEAPPGSDDERVATLNRDPLRLEATHEALAVELIASKAAVAFAPDEIDGADPDCHRIETVAEIDRRLFMR